MIKFLQITLGRSKFFLLTAVFLISFIYIQPALALEINPEEITDGDIIYFEKSVCTRGRNPVFFIQEPSGRYVNNPDYANVSVERLERCGGISRPRYIQSINGTVNITEDMEPGEYRIVVRMTRRLTDYIYSGTFFLDYENWKYSFEEQENWTENNFNDSEWDEGIMPFGNSDLLPGINTEWKNSNEIYLRKEIYLEEYRQANLKMFAENEVTCYINGEKVGSHESISARRTERCMEGSRYVRSTRVFYGNLATRTSELTYNGILFLDISQFLRPGDNVIACVAEIEEEVYRRSSRWYPGRPFVDVEFMPLKENEVFWSENSENWNSLEPHKSVYWEYQCRRTYVGSNTRGFRYVNSKVWRGPWQWNDLDVTHDTIFYSKPEQFDWARTRERRSPYWGTSPFEETTYFRNWVWAEDEGYIALRFASTQKPVCYVNEEKINIYQYNTEYWNYFSEAKLEEGVNLISCQRTTTEFDIFDINRTGLPGQLEITNVDVELEGNTANFKIDLENTSNPETQVGVFVDLQKRNETKSNFSEVTSADISMELKEKDYYYNITENFVIPKHYESINASFPRRAFDDDWGSSARVQNRRSSAQFDEIYDLNDILENQSIEIKEMRFRYRARRKTEIHILNHKTEEFEKVFSHNSNSLYIRNFEISNFTNYISENNTVHIQTKLLHGSGRYYESEVILNGIETKNQNYTQIISNSGITISVEAEPGKYNLTISAVDAITGNQAIYFGELYINGTGDIINPQTQQIGFFPIVEESETEKTGGSNNSLVAMAATASIASASIGAYIHTSKNPSTSLAVKKIDKSFANIEKVISRLDGYQNYRNHSNQQAFHKTWSEKHQIYKKNMEARAREEARIEEVRRQMIQERREREARMRQRSSMIANEFRMSLIGKSPEEQSRAIEQFLYNRRQRGLNFTEEMRDLWNTNNQIKEYLNQENNNQSSSSTGNPYTPINFGHSEENNQNASWWDNFTGAASGLFRYGGITLQNMLNLYGGIGSSILSGDIIDAAQNWYNHTKEEATLLGNVVKDNWKDIAISAGVGVAAGVIVGATGGLGMPAAAALITAAAGVGAFSFGKKYSEPLNQLNNAKTDEEINAIYEEIREELAGDAIKVGAAFTGGKAGYALSHSYFYPPSSQFQTGYSFSWKPGNQNPYYQLKSDIQFDYQYALNNPAIKTDYTGNIENFQYFNTWKTKLNINGWEVVKDNSLLSKGYVGECDHYKKIIKYTDETKVGDFYHELIHYEQGPTSSELQALKFELEAYQHDLKNAEMFGYSEHEINEIKYQIFLAKEKIVQLGGKP